MAEVAAACLRRPAAFKRATDICIVHQIGDQRFDEDGTDSRFDDLNAVLRRLAKPVKLHAIPDAK